VADLQSFKQDVQALVGKFEQDKNHYLQKGYPEAQVRIDFLNPFFDALGWDIENKAHKPPHERDVIVELSPETSLRPDYNFHINGSTKFFGEEFSRTCGASRACAKWTRLKRRNSSAPCVIRDASWKDDG
jgi:hypothetical protein